MSSAYVARYTVASGPRFRVMFRLGGSESAVRHGGSFKTQKEARARRDYIAGELAALRVPVLRVADPVRAETLTAVGDRWRASWIDGSPNTHATYRTSLGRIYPTLGDRPIDEIGAEGVRELVAELAVKYKRQSIRKTIVHLAMVFDFAGIDPNPARDRTVKLPYELLVEVDPPPAAHVLAVRPFLPAAYRLALLALDATGMRVGELERLTWLDVDEVAGRWRVSRGVAKTRQARWIPADKTVLAAVVATVPLEDRKDGGQVFAGFGADRFRTALTRACKAAGVSVFSPHDLRHRRATLWHLAGVPVAEAAAWLGHSAEEHLSTYAHAALDRTEIDYAKVLEPTETLRRARDVMHA